MLVVFTGLGTDPLKSRLVECSKSGQAQCEAALAGNATLCSLPRDAWQWRWQGRSLVTEFDLVCSQAWLAQLPAACFFAGVLAGCVIAVAAAIGLISDNVVGPYAVSAFGASPRVFLHLDPAMIVVLLAAVLFLPAIALWASRRSDYDLADFYTSGRTANAGHLMGAALCGTRTVTLRNYYLEGVIDGPLLFRTGTLVCGVILVGAVLVGMVAAR